jgi:hypothetical protein
MRRFVIAALAIAVLAAGTLVIARTAPVDNEQAAKEANRAFVANLGKGDQKGSARCSTGSPGPTPRGGR